MIDLNVFLTDIQFLDDFETRRRKINGISNKMNEDRSFRKRAIVLYQFLSIFAVN